MNNAILSVCAWVKAWGVTDFRCFCMYDFFLLREFCLSERKRIISLGSRSCHLLCNETIIIEIQSLIYLRYLIKWTSSKGNFLTLGRNKNKLNLCLMYDYWFLMNTQNRHHFSLSNHIKLFLLGHQYFVNLTVSTSSRSTKGTLYASLQGKEGRSAFTQLTPK